MSTSHRALLVLPAAALFGLAAQAAGGLFGPAAARDAFLACIVGVLVTALPLTARGLGFSIAAMAVIGGMVAAHAAGSTRLVGRAGLVTDQTAIIPLFPPAAFGIASAALIGGAVCGWLLIRHGRAWQAVALAVGALLLRSDVSGPHERYVPWFLVGSALLVAAAHAPNIRSFIAGAPVLLLVALGVVGAWLLPAARPGWSHVFADPVQSLARSDGRVQASSLLSLSGAFHPSNLPVMMITIDRNDLHPYWRAAVFDRYDGRAWELSASSVRTLGPGALLTTSRPGEAEIVTARVRVLAKSSDLFSPGPPYETSLATRVIDGRSAGEPLAVHLPRPVAAGTTYVVKGLKIMPRPAGNGPPASGDLSPYLQLPPEPSRVRGLARQLTTTRSTRIGKILAIQSYLRNGRNFHYDQTAGSPLDRDAVDDFLFVSRRGYCNQFASAMVVLAREVGIPARLVSGYASGTRRGESYLVRQRDAHSWVEAFVPATGWVTFDPTPGFQTAYSATTPSRGGSNPGVATAAPHLRRQAGLGRPRDTELNRRAHRPTGHRRSAEASPLWIWAVLALFAIGTTSVVSLAGRRSPDAFYRRVARGGSRTRERIRSGETPLEFAERFRSRPALYPDVRLLAGLYMRHRYGALKPSDDQMRQARRAAWRVAGLRLFLPPWP